MARQKTTTTSSKGECFEKVKGTPARDLKKSTNVKKPTKQGRVEKVVVKIDQKKLEVKLKAVVDIESVTTIDVTEKVRKKKVDTHSEARFRCPIIGCKQKGPIIRYRTLFDHFADCCKPEGYQNFRWWCNKCAVPRYWLMGTDLVRHGQDYHNLGEWPTDERFPG